MPVGTTRLDAELVRQGLARSRRRASDLVAEGRVSVDGRVARKPSQPVDPAAPLVVSGEQDGFVSRGAHKLAGALDALDAAGMPLALTGKRCLDAGASTGGFTQVLLERGAAHVVAVDVGHEQLAPELATDPRVTVREGVNVRDLDVSDMQGPVDVVVGDLSFISLTLVLAPLMALVRPGGALLLLVKPQFEVGRERISASGVVTSLELREQAVLTVAREAAGSADVVAVVPSPLPGPKGNREYFLLVRPGPDRVRSDDAPVVAAIRTAVRTGDAVLIRDGGP